MTKRSNNDHKAATLKDIKDLSELIRDGFNYASNEITSLTKQVSSLANQVSSLAKQVSSLAKQVKSLATGQAELTRGVQDVKRQLTDLKADTPTRKEFSDLKSSVEKQLPL